MTYSDHAKARASDRRARFFVVFMLAVLLIGTTMGLLARAGIIR